MNLTSVLSVAAGAALTVAIAALGLLRTRNRRTPGEDDRDSPVTALTETVAVHYRFATGRTYPLIGFITGRIINVKGVDVWVNGENTDMEMARPTEFSVSAVIRNYGAKKDNAGRIIEDTIYKALDKAVGSTRPVAPGSVFVTESGELHESNGVSRIIHVAAVEGQPGEGFRQVQNVGLCVRNALIAADKLAAAAELRVDGEEHPSILIPLLGTGAGRADVPTTVRELVDAAVSYAETSADSVLRRIYFLAYSERDREALTSYLDSMDRLEAAD